MFRIVLIVLCCFVCILGADGCSRGDGDKQQGGCGDESVDGSSSQWKAFISSWEQFKAVKLPGSKDPGWKDAAKEYREKYLECKEKSNVLDEVVKLGKITETEYKIVILVLELHGKSGQGGEEEIGEKMEEDLSKRPYKDEVSLMLIKSSYSGIMDEVEFLRDLSRQKKCTNWILDYYVDPIARSLVDVVEKIEMDNGGLIEDARKAKMMKNLNEVSMLMLKIYSRK